MRSYILGAKFFDLLNTGVGSFNISTYTVIAM